MKEQAIQILELPQNAYLSWLLLFISAANKMFLFEIPN